MLARAVSCHATIGRNAARRCSVTDALDPRPAVKRPAKTPAPPDIEVRRSEVHGTGVFAQRALPRGAAIGRYEGRRYPPSEVDSRDWDHSLTYVFGLSDGSLIDGSDGGNATRFLNHSCAPNCIAYEVTSPDGERWIEIETRRRVRSGAELFIDYCLNAGDADPADYPCRCGARRCRGSLLAPRPAAP